MLMTIETETGAHFLLTIFACFAVPVAFLFYFFGRRRIPPTYQVAVPEPCYSNWKGDVLESPDLKITGSSIIQCYNPANAQRLGTVNPVTPDGIDRAIARARDAQIEWSRTTWAQRCEWLRSLKKHILDNQRYIVEAACLDSGKTHIDAYFGEILVTLEKIDWMIKHGERSLRPERRPTNLLMCYKQNEVRWEPLGVVCACVSWNYPFHNLLGPIISSLFAGNSIVLKPSERTAWSSQYFISIARGALTACGHSPQLIQSCICWPSVAPHLVSHPDIAHLTFIGSREVAHQVAKTASESLVPLCLELGGKDPAIILDDVADRDTELDRVIAILVRGVFQAAGQNCIGIERIIAQPRVYSRLFEKLEPIVRGLRCADPLDTSIAAPVDVGACISDANFSRLEDLIAEACQQGARLVVGGRRYDRPGHYFQPTLLVDVKPSMRIAQTELFAPIMVLMPTETAVVDEAITLANSSPYGLGSSVFGRNAQDLEKVVKELKTGMIAVNDFAAFYAVQLPFGGVGGSGYGRFAGKEGLRSVCNMKSVCKDGWWGLTTSIPPPLQIPFGSPGRAGTGLKQAQESEKSGKEAEQRAEQMVRGVVELGYGESLSRRLGGLRRILGI